MSNAIVLPTVSSVDTGGQTILVSFKTGDGTSAIPARELRSLTISTGPTASSFTAGIPFVEALADEEAFNIALQSKGPAAALKLLTRAEASIMDNTGKNGVAKCCGFITHRQHIYFDGNIFDNLNVHVQDDLWLLTKYKIFGKHEYDPENGNSYYNAAGKCVFNPHGLKNRADSSSGPRFTPSNNTGYSGENGKEHYDDPSEGGATKRASSWSTRSVLEYILRHYFASNGGGGGPSRNFGALQVPAFVKVAVGIIGLLPDRPLRDVNYDGWTVLDAIHDILRRSGAFEIRAKALGNFESEIVLVDINPSYFTTIYPPGAKSDDPGALMNDGSVFKYAVVEEDVADLSTSVNLQGDPTVVETFASTDSQGTGANKLKFGWTDKELQDARAFLEDPNEAGTSRFSLERFKMMCNKFPRVGAWYQINDSDKFNIFEGTKNSRYKLKVKNGVMLATQLTAVNTDNSPVGWQPMEIRVEVKLTDYEFDEEKRAYTGQNPPAPVPVWLKQWKTVGRFDELRLSPDGKFVQLDGLRISQSAENTETSFYTDYGDDPGHPHERYSKYLTPREIRLQVAVESDIPANSYDESDPNSIGGRLADGAPNLTLQIRAGPLSFVDWLRHIDSRPLGESGFAPPERQFPEKASAGNELYSDFKGEPGSPNDGSRARRMTDAKIRELKRIALSGKVTFPKLNPATDPGFAAEIGGGVMEGLRGVFKAVTYSADDQATHCFYDGNRPSPLFEERGGIPAPHNSTANKIIDMPRSNIPDIPSDNSKPQVAPSTASTATESSGYQGPSVSPTIGPRRNASNGKTGAEGDTGGAGNEFTNPPSYTGAPRPYKGKDYSQLSKPNDYSIDSEANRNRRADIDERIRQNNGRTSHWPHATDDKNMDEDYASKNGNYQKINPVPGARSQESIDSANKLAPVYPRSGNTYGSKDSVDMNERGQGDSRRNEPAYRTYQARGFKPRDKTMPTLDQQAADGTLNKGGMKK